MKYSSHGKKLILLSTLLLFAGNMLYAQNNSSQNSFSDHLRYGGNVGLRFGDDYFVLDLSPKVIYDFNQYFSAGLGLIGGYYENDEYTAYSYGGSAVLLFNPVRRIQMYAEFREFYVNANSFRNYWHSTLFLGLGYTTGHITAGFRYNVLYDEDKGIYENALMPYVSVYF